MRNTVREILRRKEPEVVEEECVVPVESCDAHEEDGAEQQECAGGEEEEGCHEPSPLHDGEVSTEVSEPEEAEEKGGGYACEEEDEIVVFVDDDEVSGIQGDGEVVVLPGARGGGGEGRDEGVRKSGGEWGQSMRRAG